MSFTILDAVTGYLVRNLTAMLAIVTPNTAKIDADDEALHRPQIEHSGTSYFRLGGTE